MFEGIKNWFTGSKPAVEQCEINKPKPCCVCKDEKATRDECLLKFGQDSGKCDDIILAYKKCMKGYGFETF
ncbi:copper metallochaperone COX17 [Ascoidea rubescens DSM 1968]|uniref:Cytochrome c oxidase assembly protein/Cu2+ chaperone n=1 Tax=Ascoidea rubescens DSM 1968 TaxID=1344418 RepID=A0A1D2VCV4_9ASCO|nr:cytochrome c oxidase assembly protein/Cu2+ chaperone [Ascoidea rubescens DSM 1968]ODV59350.1 cytochrome c oxidase assembly protein/Cu2+ chaperone [Ascoidea rubescens DSM 1968]